jgi:hypothetical protein
MRDPSGQNLAPRANAVLAYGAISRARVWGPAAALIFGFLILALGAFVWHILSTPLPVPKTAFLIFYARPSLTMPDGAPAIWREMQIKSKPWPMLAGMAKNSNNQPYAFAITPSLFSSWVLHGPESADATEPRPLSDLADWHSYFSRAWLQIWPGKIGETGSISALEQHFGGALTPKTWSTDLPAPAVVTQPQLYFATNYLDIKSLPFMWPILENELRNQGINMNLGITPAQISWRVDTKNGLQLALGFENPIDAGLRAQIAASFGLVERQPYALSDGTISDELITPIQELGRSPTSTWILSDGENLIFNEKTVLYGLNIGETWVKIPPESKSNQGVLAIFDTQTLSALATKFGFKNLLLPEAITLTESKGKLKLSW